MPRIGFLGLVLALASLPGLASARGDAVRIEGRVLERGTREPMVAVRVYLLPEQKSATTDEEGRFVIEDAKAGEVRWVIQIPGYRKLEQVETLDSEEPLTHRDLFLEVDEGGALETAVYAKEEKKDDSARALTKEQIESMPGARGDPIRAVQNLPGIARTQSQKDVIIQGAGPENTLYAIDGHQVPLSFHLFGNSSVLFPEAIDRVEYLSAGFGPDYGRALGGVIGLWTRAPRNDRLHGTASIDLLNSGLLFEGPVGRDSSLLFGVRRSYLDLLLKTVGPQVADPDYLVKPEFSDFSSIYEARVSPRDRFKIVSLGSVDTLSFLNDDVAPSIERVRGNYDFKRSFLRFIPQLTHEHGSRTMSRWSLGLGRDWFRYHTKQVGYEAENYSVTDSLTARVDVLSHLSELWDASLGLDHAYHHVQSRTKIRKLSAGGSKLVTNSAGLYWKNTVRLGNSPWTLLPGLRFDYFSSTSESVLEPRLGARYQVSESFLLRAAGGLYAQEPENSEIRASDGRLKATRAVHFALSGEKDFRGGSARGVIASIGGFYREFDRLVSSKREPRNEGEGRAFGAEALVQLKAQPFEAWVAYTVSRSTRRDSAGSGEYLFDYDQTHNLNVMGSVDLPRGWTLSTRCRFVSGDPTTPYLGGVFDSDNQSYRPIVGEYNSGRLRSFLQLDLRVDKKWTFDRWMLSAYLDVLNVTNRGNAEAVRPTFDYEDTVELHGIPILPMLGLKAEF